MNIIILHLSDLHIVSKNGTYSEVLKNLIADIKIQTQNLNRIIIAVTGDIIDKAQFTPENIDVTIKFFKDLYEVLQGKVTAIEIVPGNHDKRRDAYNTELVDKQKNSIEIPNLSNESWKYFLVSYSDYLDLINRIRKIFNKNYTFLKNTYYTDVVNAKEFNVFFINLDSSWSSFGGVLDKRSLRINQEQLKELNISYHAQKNKCETSDDSKKNITILTAHHPLNWLNEKDETLLASWLLDSEYFGIDFYLCGHTHDRQIQSHFDTNKSYVTLVTGIGSDENDPNKSKDQHRYSIYNINPSNNSCETIIRKTCVNGTFDYDNDILLTDIQKVNKRIHLPIKSHDCTPTIEFYSLSNNVLKNSYLFVNNTVMKTIKSVQNILLELCEFSKSSQIKKAASTEDSYKSFTDYLVELCNFFNISFKKYFPEIKCLHLHIRKYFKVKGQNNSKEIYISICQSRYPTDNNLTEIRDVDYDDLVKPAFDCECSFTFTNNDLNNALTSDLSYCNNFLVMASNIPQNIYEYKMDRRLTIRRPYLSAIFAVNCTHESLLLKILPFLNIDKFFFTLIYEYVDLVEIDMKNFLDYEI